MALIGNPDIELESVDDEDFSTKKFDDPSFIRRCDDIFFRHDTQKIGSVSHTALLNIIETIQNTFSIALLDDRSKSHLDSFIQAEPNYLWSIDNFHKLVRILPKSAGNSPISSPRSSSSPSPSPSQDPSFRPLGQSPSRKVSSLSYNRHSPDTPLSHRDRDDASISSLSDIGDTPSSQSQNGPTPSNFNKRIPRRSNRKSTSYFKRHDDMDSPSISRKSSVKMNGSIFQDERDEYETEYNLADTPEIDLNDLNVPSPERNQIVSLSKKLHSYEHKFNTMAQNYETEISHLQNLIKELKSEVQKRNKEIIDLNGKEKNLLTHIEEIENSNQKLSEAIKTWKSNCHQYKLQFEEKSAHETSLLYQLKAKEGETRDLQRDIELLRNEIEKYERNNEKLEKHIASLQETIAETNKLNDILKTEKGNLEMELEEIKSNPIKFGDSQDGHISETSRPTAKSLMQELGDWKSEQAIVIHNDNDEVMQTDIMVLEEEIKKIETERDATFTLLEQERLKNETLLQTLEEERETQTFQIQSLTEKIEAQQCELQSLHDIIEQSRPPHSDIGCQTNAGPFVTITQENENRRLSSEHQGSMEDINISIISGHDEQDQHSLQDLQSQPNVSFGQDQNGDVKSFAPFFSENYNSISTPRTVVQLSPTKNSQVQTEELSIRRFEEAKYTVFLEGHVQKLENELSATIAEADTKIERLNNTISNLKTEKTELLSKIAILENELKNTKESLELQQRYQTQFEHLFNQLKNMENQSMNDVTGKELHSTKEKLQERIKELELEVEKYRETITRLESEAEQATRALHEQERLKQDKEVAAKVSSSQIDLSIGDIQGVSRINEVDGVVYSLIDDDNILEFDHEISMIKLNKPNEPNESLEATPRPNHHHNLKPLSEQNQPMPSSMKSISTTMSTPPIPQHSLPSTPLSNLNATSTNSTLQYSSRISFSFTGFLIYSIFFLLTGAIFAFKTLEVSIQDPMYISSSSSFSSSSSSPSFFSSLFKWTSPPSTQYYTTLSGTTRYVDFNGEGLSGVPTLKWIGLDRLIMWLEMYLLGDSPRDVILY